MLPAFSEEEDAECRKKSLAKDSVNKEQELSVYNEVASRAPPSLAQRVPGASPLFFYMARSIGWGSSACRRTSASSPVVGESQRMGYFACPGLHRPPLQTDVSLEPVAKTSYAKDSFRLHPVHCVAKIEAEPVSSV